MNSYYCPNCSVQRDIAALVLGKIGGALVGGALGGKTGNPWATLLGVLAGTLIGHALDESWLRRCPECGGVLQLLGENLA